MWASARSLGVWGHAPAQCIWQGSGFAADQTNAMLAVARRRPPSPSPERTTNPSSRRKRQDSLSLSLVLFPPKPLRRVSAGPLLGTVIKTLVLHFFDTSVWGWYHYPRRALHAVETLDARGSRRLICRFYAAPEFVLCGQNIPSSGTHATPAPNRAHSGSHAETRGIFTARDIGRVDRVNGSGILCIVTFGTVQLNEPLAVAAAHHGGNSGFA